MIVYTTKPLTRKRFPGDNCTRLKPDIQFGKVEDNYKSDSGDAAVIHVKINNTSLANEQNTKNMNFPVIKYFDNQVPKVVLVLQDMAVIMFEKLGITT